MGRVPHKSDAKTFINNLVPQRTLSAENYSLEQLDTQIVKGELHLVFWQREVALCLNVNDDRFAFEFDVYPLARKVTLAERLCELPGPRIAQYAHTIDVDLVIRIAPRWLSEIGEKDVYAAIGSDNLIVSETEPDTASVWRG